MTSRDRVLKALNHEETDRVPLDLGSTVMTGIMAQALDRLRKHLGLAPKPVQVYEVFQMLGEVEMDLVEQLDLDVLPVEPPVLFFGLRRENYKPWKLFDGTEVLVPGQFEVEADERGDWLLHHEGDPSQPVEGHMPRNGYYFDRVGYSDMTPSFTPPPLEEVRATATRPSDEDLAWMRDRADWIRQNTDKAVLLGYWTAVGLGGVGSMTDWLCLFATDPQYVRDLIAMRGEILIENLATLWDAIGDRADVVGIEGQDFGTQRGEIFSPAFFEEVYYPQYCKVNAWVHEHTTWKTWQHCCGSISNILPLLADSGLDAINPVQCSARGMDPTWLKDTLGDRLTFWGGGVDTQKTLPFGTVTEVEEEVAARVRTFGKGGGFVFNPVHNVQHATPPENIVAAYGTAAKTEP